MTKAEQDRLIADVFARKSLIETEKKNTLQTGHTVVNKYTPGQRAAASKAEVSAAIDEPTVLNAKLVINTTNLIDSHNDCHIPGLWKKTISEIQMLYLLQEHSMKFDKVIADSVKDDLKASTETVSWSELGYSYSGDTEALIFQTKIRKDRNPFMFEQYAKGYVHNHSVGMRYNKLYLCINRDDAEYAAEKDNWDKYYPLVANKEVADACGYFWAVTEAKLVEGSAVVKGSNEATPAMSITNEAADKGTPYNPEPSDDTPKSTISNYLI